MQKNMPQQLPQHKAFMLSDFGVRLRRIAPPQTGSGPVAYAHQDDYYIVGLVEKGTGRGIIDFKECSFAQGEVFLIQPGQVHRFIGSEDAEGWMLFADSSFVGSEEKNIFDNFLLFAPAVKIDGRRMGELKQLAGILAGRVDCITGEQAKATARRLAETFIGIVAEAVQEAGLNRARHSRRHVEIVLSFRSLLAGHLAANRYPSYYASMLNISPVYLNEVVKEVAGMSASSYIRNEMVLQAKRMLVYTGLSVKEISNRLGIEDCAYFSRLFTRTTGLPPSLFRQKNLE